ncbi:MAG TPA: ABC transporter substrate-binding protein [Acidimicrobiales bacterium]|jgi:ABC-type transport system substrate-binding protein|nr:ABC transporter substrate-binding protein [Acidimicrobiales bacterium]
MAGSVVDGLLANVAGATVGVNKAKPKLGGTLTVGLISDVPNFHVFNGAQGKMDVSAFCVANALYDPLFVMSLNGKVALPMLALSASHNADYTVWTIALRQNVKFTNGDPFNADILVANYNAAKADPTVGLAIQPIISSVTKVDTYTVAYNMAIPFSAFPITLAEQQIAYIAHPSSFVPTYTGNPIGTGPFKVKSWQVGVESQFTKNAGYWRKDGSGRKLPYLNGINFKTIVDDASRNQALQSGGVDMIIQQSGAQIAGLKKIKNISYVTDVEAPRDPSVNCLIMNTTGTLNQYFCWAGQFASIGVPGSLPYILKGQAPPTAVQQADFVGTLGAVNPSTLQWDTTLKPVVNDVTIRKACAMAINRSTYFKVIDGSVGAVADGVYRKTSPFYRNPGYPAYNPAKAKALVNAYKSANSVSKVGFVIDTVSGNSSANQAFAFFQQQLAAVGITVTQRQLVQSTLINNVIYGEYDCSTWNQFGGVDPSLNYVWFLSLSATASPAVGGLGMAALPAGTYIAGAVNFAHQGDSTIENSMLRALAAPPGSALQKTSWQTVNTQFARVFPYLFLDTLVSALAARKNVQNWVSGTAADGTTRCLSPDGGSARWDQIWKS